KMFNLPSIRLSEAYVFHQKVIHTIFLGCVAGKIYHKTIAWAYTAEKAFITVVERGSARIFYDSDIETNLAKCGSHSTSIGDRLRKLLSGLQLGVIVDCHDQCTPFSWCRCEGEKQEDNCENKGQRFAHWSPPTFTIDAQYGPAILVEQSSRVS